MKVIKLAFISILVLFFILTGMGLLLPATVRVTRNIALQAPFDSVYNYAANTLLWTKWMAGIDSNTVQFSSPQSNTAAVAKKLQIRLLPLTKNEVKSVWQTNNRRRQLCVIQVIANEAANSTTINWYFEQKLRWYPWERLPAIANDKVMGPFMEKSLDNLKALIEEQSR